MRGKEKVDRSGYLFSNRDLFGDRAASVGAGRNGGQHYGSKCRGSRCFWCVSGR